MGAILPSLGLGEGGGTTGSSGLKFAAQGAPIMETIKEGNLKSGWDQSQDAIAKQVQFLNALQAQNGIQNQSDVYNRLQGIANGTGPNPAQAALNQATSANIANQAALMAGQRGAAMNPGLIARQAAMQGGALQQQAAGQGATLQAQQAMNAINQMGGIAGQQVGQQQQAIQGYNTGAQNLYNIAQNAAAAMNNARVGMTSNQNQANAGIAGVAAKGQQDLLGKVTGAAGSAATGGAAHGGLIQKYAGGGQVSDYLSPALVQSAPIQTAAPMSNVGQYAASNGNLQGFSTSGDFGNVEAGAGLGQGASQLGSAIGSRARSAFSASPSSTQMAGGPMDAGMPASQAVMVAHGGAIQKFADGGQYNTPTTNLQSFDTSGSIASAAPAPGKGPDLMALAMKFGPMLFGAPPMAHGGNVPVVGEHLAAQKETVPGQAKVKGDSEVNDVVDAKLSPGEVVIPRSVMNSKDPVKKSAEFVAAVLRKKGRLK